MAAVKEKAMSDVQQATASSSDTAANNLAQSMVSSVVTSFTPEKLKKSALGGIAAAAFCLLVAIMMWGLKKNGFYLYILGTLIGIAVPFMIFGNNLLALGASAVMGFFGILFVILYGVNLKHMR